MYGYDTVGDDEGEVHEGNAADDLLVAEVFSRGVVVYRGVGVIVVRLLWRGVYSIGVGQQWISLPIEEDNVFIRWRLCSSH